MCSVDFSALCDYCIVAVGEYLQRQYVTQQGFITLLPNTIGLLRAGQYSLIFVI